MANVLALAETFVVLGDPKALGFSVVIRLRCITHGIMMIWLRRDFDEAQSCGNLRTD
ncbi:hypothetical protein [Sphingopyxis terrae]|uniref:hypothetical protein n=1 Tax=Sphingopyxis terrae TaxID=33052 RepID=UPI0013C43400|nr:hypothetical protein [Sphingopyxis terrae]